MKIPSRYGAAHMVVPAQDLLCLVDHGIHLLFSERNGPVCGGECVAGNIECQQLPERQRNLAVKIAVHHTGGEQGGLLRTPHDPVEFLPRVSVITAVKINDAQLSALVDHHIADVIVAVLIHLRPAFQQIAVFIDVVNKGLPLFILDRRLLVFFDFVVHLPIKPAFPILLRLRSRYGVDPTKNAAGFQAVHILLGIRKRGNNLFGVHTINPALDRIDAFFTGAKR